MTSAIKTYAQISPERIKSRNLFKIPANNLEATRTGKISPVQNGSFSPPLTYSGTLNYDTVIKV